MLAIFGFVKTKLKVAILYILHIIDRVQCKGTPSFADGLPANYWGITVDDRKHLLIQECDVVTLASRHGTPLYVVDKERLKNTYLHFYSSFKDRYPRIEVAYSYKTNPVPRVISVLHELGASAEVISEFELWLALKLGVPPERIIYNGPAKTRKSLELAVSKNIKLINIDSLAEIDIIDSLAGQYGGRQRVGVRVITSVGWSSQFGLSIKSGMAFEAFQTLKTRDHVVACGLHIHLGTGIQDVGTYLQAIKEVLDFSERLQRELDIVIEYLDFGGGFGVPTVRSYSQIDFKLMQNDFPPRMAKFRRQVTLEQYSDAITELVYKYYPMTSDRLPTIIFEPGRAITSGAQSLLLEVITVKTGLGKAASVILNGGKNISMPMGYEYHEIFLASKMMEPATNCYDLFGPLCHPGDIVFKAKWFPKMGPGDVLAIMDAGAYFVPNQMNFSNPRPGIVMVGSGKEEVIRTSESFEDIVARDVL